MLATRPLCLLALVIFGPLFVSAHGAYGQSPPRGARAPDPEEVILTTRDGVRLGGTYYRSTKGRQAVPIVMLHDFNESRTVFNRLARELQAPTDENLESHAVLTIDLRGHGSSTTAVDRFNQTSTLNASRFRPADFENMVRFDMEEVRKFLVKENDEQQLNLNKLCLLGTGMGANLAVVWSAVDWSTPNLPRVKQGQDVKALILASPEWRFRGLSMVQALKHPDVRSQLSIMLVYGEQDSNAAADAENVHRNLVRYHPDPPIDRIATDKTLFKVPLPTRLQGSKLLVDPEFSMLPRIDNFLQMRLVRQDFEWLGRLKE